MDSVTLQVSISCQPLVCNWCGLSGAQVAMFAAHIFTARIEFRASWLALAQTVLISE